VAVSQPTLISKRLVLRPFETRDAKAVQELAGDRAIADTTVNIPHPYEDGMAESWIANHRTQFDEGINAVFAITEKTSAVLIGAIGLEVDGQNRKAELGYWIGVPYWNNGFASEAAAEVVRFGFEELDLNRIGAGHFFRNPASGRVMQKIGMTYEGRFRQGAKRWDTFEDLEMYGLLRSEWLTRGY
jgi:RimJ/RimL family protein N-acetyltransferase